MKKLCIILSVILCLSLLGGCSVDITIRDESGSSIPLPDGVESVISDIIADHEPSKTTTNNSSTTESASTESTTVTTKQSTTKASTANTEKTSGKTNSSSKKPDVSKSSTTSTTSTTKAATTTTKKNHGTPNINGTFHDDMANEVLTKLNAARKAKGLGELTMDNGNMMTAAKIRAKEITVHWAHERPDGDSWDTVFNEEGVKYNARGENLADGHKTADAVFQGWMNSRGHKANIMEPRFTHISIVCLEVDDHFYWVQLFGANIKR